MNTLFISDIHLSPQYPHTSALFLHFLQEKAVKAQALYILGDFFDVYLGDDMIDAFQRKIIEALKQLVDSGVAVYLMPGNRDFLYGKQFEKQSGVILISDPLYINLYGKPTLLTHGDALCTDDKPYQYYRAFVRNPLTQWLFLHSPILIRQKIAKFLRKKSREENQQKAAYLMDVNQDAVKKIMRKFQVARLIHGHTHTPQTIHFILNKESATRTVLGAWEKSAHVLITTPNEQHIEELTLSR